MLARLDEDAFHDFVVARSPALHQVLRVLCVSGQEVRRPQQTALFKTAKSWGRIHASPEAYARRIIYTENVSQRRRTRHLKESSLAEYDGPTVAADPDLALSLEQALAQLTLRQRSLLVLRFYEDLTEAQTACVLGISAGTVKTSTRQALARLRQVAPHLGELIEAAP